MEVITKTGKKTSARIHVDQPNELGVIQTSEKTSTQNTVIPVSRKLGAGKLITFVFNPEGSQYPNPNKEEGGMKIRTRTTLQAKVAGNPNAFEVVPEMFDDFEKFRKTKAYQDIKDLLPSVPSLDDLPVA